MRPAMGSQAALVIALCGPLAACRVPIVPDQPAGPLLLYGARPPRTSLVSPARSPGHLRRTTGERLMIGLGIDIGDPWNGDDVNLRVVRWYGGIEVVLGVLWRLVRCRGGSPLRGCAALAVVGLSTIADGSQ